MTKTVIKRDGRRCVFNEEKIKEALLKAFVEVDSSDAVKDGNAIALINKIATEIKDEADDVTSVEAIQDLVEAKLMASSRKDVAKAYILYRDKRSKIREKNSDLMRVIKKKLEATDVQNQNANVDEKSFGGRMGAVNSEVLKQYALDNCMSEMARNNHLNNEIYIHDLDSYSLGNHNCLSIPFDKLLANGFNTRQTDVRPAQSVSTAFQLVAVLFQLQSLQEFGGVSATHLDWTMVPYVRKSFYKHYVEGCKYIEGYKEVKIDFDPDELIDSPFYTDVNEGAYQYAMDMTKKEVYQAAEGLYHNLNTLQSRSGNQLK